jgi:hypothetical protein
MNREELEKEVTGLLKLAKTSTEAFRKYNEAQKNGVKEEELKKLEDAKALSRATFDDEYKKVIGEDKQKGKMWACFAQKAHVLGMIGPQIYLYVKPYELGQQFWHTAEAYIAGHKLLGWEITRRINPVSLQDLDKGLVRAEEKAVENCDVSRKEAIMKIRLDIKRHAGALLNAKIEKQKERTLTLGEKLGTEAVNELQSVVNKSEEKPKESTKPTRRNKK